MRYESIGSFFTDTKDMLYHYAETRAQLFKLQAARIMSKLIADVIWMIISIFLVFVLIIFGGITLGFWLSSVTGSYISGFGYTALGILFIIIMLAILRKKLFLNPIIRISIRRIVDDEKTETHSPTSN